MTQENQTVDLTVTLDKDLAASGEALFNRLGMNFSMAFSAFIYQSVKKGNLPFETDGSSKLRPYANGREYRAEMLQRLADVRAGRNIVQHDLIEAENDA